VRSTVHDRSETSRFGRRAKAAKATVARRGRSVASVEIAKCDDGLFRYATHILYSYGGFGGPITDDHEGYATTPVKLSLLA